MKEKSEIVYVVAVDDVYDYEKNILVNVYSSLEDAKEEVKRHKALAIDGEIEDGYVLLENENGFSYFLDGDYTSNHYDVEILERNIN